MALINWKSTKARMARDAAIKESLASGDSVYIPVNLPNDSGGMLQNVTEEQIAQALAARKAGKSVSFGDWGTTQANAVLDYMIQNNMSPTVSNLGSAQIPSGQFTQSNFGLSGLVSDIAPYAKMLAATAGAAYLGGGGLTGGAGSGAGAGMTTAELAAADPYLASIGGASGVTPAMETASMLSAAGSPGVAAGTAASNVSTGMGYGSLGSTAAEMSAAGMTDAQIAAALESGAYGGITGTMPAELGSSLATSLGTSAAGGLLGMGGNTLASLASGAASLYGANQAAGSAADAYNIQKQSADAALAEQKRQFDLAQSGQMPWRTAGEKALGEQVNLMGLGSQGAEGQLAALMKSPGYEFRLGEGTKALERSAAAKGGLFGGATGKALTRYGQDYGSQEYGNRLSQLSSLSGQGQAAASGQAGIGMNYAGNVSNLLTGLGSAGAASNIAQGAARQSGILGAGQALSSLFNPPKAQPTFRIDPSTGQYVYG